MYLRRPPALCPATHAACVRPRVPRPHGVRPSPTAALRNRGFRLYQVARFGTVVATQMMSVAVGWHVYDITRRPLDLGYVGLAQFLPGILLFPISGHTSDRFERRNVLSEIGRAS